MPWDDEDHMELTQIRIALERIADALEGRTHRPENPCDECREREAEVSPPWNREQKVCAQCWDEIADGCPISDADRIEK